MFETLGSYSQQTINMSTQNGSYLEVSWKRNFDSHLRISFPICLHREAISLVPRPHPPKEGKGLAHFEPFLVFADSTVQDPGLPIRLQACDFIM